VGTTVTLTGSGFTSASSVAFHGTLASSFAVNSDAQLTAIVPAGAASGHLSVTTPGGSATSSGAFTVSGTPPPPPSTTTTTAYYGGGIAESVNGALSYLLSDPVLGSASASVSLGGAVTATQLYSPYGGVRYQSGILPTDIGFTHQRTDATTGLDDYGARWYDPLAGQFASADMTLAGGLNRYGYVGGNPESATDPSGHLRVKSTPAAHQYTEAEAMHQAQTQPVKVYANQWAAPGTVGGFISYLSQAVLNTDTLKHTLHTMLDPHASLGDKAKATGVFVFTAFTDALTLASIVTAQPEGVEGARAADAAVFAFADLDHLAVGADATKVVNTGVGAAGDASGGASRTLFHYTTGDGLNGILDDGAINPSLKSLNPNDVRYGDGQYLSDIKPGVMTSNQLSRAFLGAPFWGSRYTHFVEIDVTGLNVVEGRAGVFVVPNEVPLDVNGRIMSWGMN
jgi:RHS repeat-associated protein